MAGKYASILERLVAHGRGGTMKNLPSEVGLERTRKVLETLLGNDLVDKVGERVIHIVGTNGKGSVAWKTANTLLKNGYCRSVGLYTSPHLFSVRERIRVNGNMISVDQFEALGEEILSISDENSSYFELMTCLAITHFVRNGCDALVLEAGMGGKGDATNVLSNSRVAVLTSVALDHVHVLGPTVTHICKEKIGVVKRGTRVVVGPGVPTELDNIIYSVSSMNGARSIKRVLPNASSTETLGFDKENASVAKACVEEFLSGSHIIAIDQSRPRCRLETIIDKKTGKPLVLDVGHNSAALRYATGTLLEDTNFCSKRPGLLFAVAADKDAEACLEELIPMKFSRIEFVQIKNKGRRFADPEALASMTLSMDHHSRPPPERIGHEMSITEAVKSILEDPTVDYLLCCGSHGIMAEVLTASGNPIEDMDPLDSNERGAKDM